ncbi:MAG TPA: aminotransferase class III-fold pyridoxal phosphate-dependent enzyme, partial [Anaerolineae bacterium]|nr:aminotransferase class III-fold pyridoxal phosphate-dependent enzyme [Anaerolineae bacterium]
ASRPLHTSHAFHSPMMDPILEAFTVEVSQVKLNPPRIPFISSPTGTWITPAEATEPAYWARHLRQTVRFAEGRRELAKMPDQVLLEVGPGSTLASLAKHPAYAASEQIVLSSLGHVLDNHQDLASILHALGQLWLAGVAVDWAGYYAYERRQRLALPTYPFERQRYWIDPPQHENHGDLPTPTVNDNFEVQLAAGKAAEILPEIPHEKEMAMLETGSSPNGIPARKERILAELKSTMHDIGGLNPAEIDGQATFLELGFDSLFLTQASLAFKKKFAVKITFRQLLEDTSTLKALADYIDGQLPPEDLPAEPAPPSLVTTNRPETSTPARPAPFSDFSDELQRVAAGNGDQGAMSGSALERVINQQLQLMAKQLEALRQAREEIQTAPPLHESLSDPRNHPLEPANGQVNSTPLQEREAGALTQAADRETHETKRFGPWKPINQSALSGLDLRQQKHLADLISRYTARTRQSKQLTQAHRPHLADPRSVSGFRTAWKELVYPIVAVRSSGSKLWDVDGNEYVDVQSGFGSVFFGHSPEFIRQAVEEQLKLGVQIGPQSPLAGEVAKLICEFSGMERVTFCNTGSEAVLAALRVARTVTGRTKIAMFAHDYHGIFDEVLGRSIALGRGSRVVPIAPGILPQMVENVLLLEYGDPNSLDLLREHAGDLAAVLVEPVQSRHPDLQPREFLHELRAWTEQAEILLIFDEVVTGFRLHPGGAQAWFGVQADLVTYGKIVGGGMPLGILAGKATFMDALDGGMWTYGDASFPEVGVTYFAGTFVRHPLALAAASAVLNRLKLSGPELQQRLNETASRFARELNEYFEQRHAPLHLEQCASMLYLKFLEESEFSSLLFFYLREKGVHILEGGSFFLTTAHTDADLALVRQAIKESVAEMQEAGFLPGSLSEFSPRESAQLKFPLTEGQMEIWLASQMGEAASRAFNEAFTLRLQGPLKVEHLREAVQTVIARHEALHVRFSPSGDYQERMTPASLDICLQDCSTLAAVVKEATVAEILKKEASETFDLINGPLWRAQILKLEAEEVLFIFSAHHIVFDGWSAGVLLHEIGLVYSALCQRQPYRLPEPTSFVAYATAEAEAQASPEVAQTYQYWLDQFADLPSPLDLPTDRPRPAMKSYSGGTVKRTFKPEVAQALKRTAAAQGVTLFTMLLAAYNLLLSRLTGQEDIVVGVSAAGQAMTGQAPLVGHCVNLLPLRSRLDSEASFKDFLASIRIAVLDAYDHQQCTFGSILQRLKLGRDPSHLPLVQATFNLDPDLVGHGFHGLAASMEPVPKQAVNFDIFFNINEGQGGLTANCHYNTDLFDEETISRWLGHYETLLEGLAANPDQDLSALPLLSETERNHLLVTLNQTHRPFPNDKCIHHLFEAQVERSPHAIAV